MTHQSSEFYVTLPSNSSALHFPDNKPGLFTTNLAHPINLRGRWECALSELTYPVTWYNISPDADFYILHTETGRVKTVTVPEGYYADVAQLLSVMYNLIVSDDPSYANAVGISIDEINGKAVFDIAVGYQILWVDEQLAQVFGMMRHTASPSGVSKSARPIDIRRGSHGLFVYTDIVSHSMVGDSSVPLLRIVPLDGLGGEMVTRTYDKMHYVPISRSNIDTIEMNISDEFGRIINFKGGRTVAKLHFRPRRLLYM
jgi:hypothetical protein